MYVSSSTPRSVLIAAWTTDAIDCGSMGILGRKRHSYSYSSPVPMSMIG